MISPELPRTAHSIIEDGKGIAALDESPGTMGKRFAAHGIENTILNRANYRENLITTPGINKPIGGVIVHPEMIMQRAADGSTFAEILEDQNIALIAKVDEGLLDHPFSPKEQITKGLDNLSALLEKYRNMGAVATKWRSVIRIDEADDLPTAAIVDANLSGQALYAALAQKEGLMPIVEPEVLINGRHSIETAKRVGEIVIEDLFYRLEDHGVDISAILLKPSMIVPGDKSPGREEMSPSRVAELTIGAYEQTVPQDVPGVVFLSGGLSPIEATMNLNAINLEKPEGSQITYSFSYGRALQEYALAAWAEGDYKGSQDLFMNRAEMNSEAAQGEWELTHEHMLPR